MIAGLIEEILAPSRRDEGAYTFSVIALGHVVVGAALVSLFGLVTPEETLAIPAVRILLSVGYWLAKERNDLSRGGSWFDSLMDTFYIWVGTLYDGPAWWPASVFLAVALGLILRHFICEGRNA